VKLTRYDPSETDPAVCSAFNSVSAYRQVKTPDTFSGIRLAVFARMRQIKAPHRFIRYLVPCARQYAVPLVTFVK
jgi:hypothetical protein